MREKTAKEIMATDPVTMGCNDSLRLAKDIMALARIRHFPVVLDGKVVGVVSQRDLFRASLASVLAYDENAQRTFLETITVKTVMSETPITVSPDTPIKTAARLMVEKRIGCLPIVDGEKLVGLVTETDLLRELAEA
jgi:CBS domain-containing protein